jgi:ketosteroid isomerase-like protein
MDLLSATTSTALPTSPEEAYREIRRLADRAALVDLSVLYSMAVDDHDLDTVVSCFAPDGTFTRLGTTVRGHADLRTFYASMMDRYVTTLHTPESHVAVVDVEAGTARGVVNGHGELALGHQLLLAAYRYDDSYVRLDGRWVFAARSIRFMYNVPFEEFGTSFADDRRLRVPGTEVAAGDYPETLPTWSTPRP